MRNQLLNTGVLTTHGDPKSRDMIYVLMDHHDPAARKMLAGIRRYVTESSCGWHLRLMDPAGPLPRSDLPRGFLGKLGLIDRAVIQSEPHISVHSADRVRERNKVYSDPVASGRLAAEHLMRCGLKQLACLEPAVVRHSPQMRITSFIETCRSAGASVSLLKLPSQSQQNNWDDSVAWLAERLRELSGPLGLMATFDFLGLMASDACRQVGLVVPDQVAILGHGNDEALCEFCQPSLSSIDTDQLKIGYHAAELLDRLIQRADLPLTPVRIPPLGVVHRGTTETQLSSDPLVASALAFIRKQLPNDVKPQEVIEHVPASSSTLARRFQAVCGMTIGQVIRREKVDRVAGILIRQPDKPLVRIARECGYVHLSQLCRDFKKIYGITPTEHRLRYR